MIFYENHLRVFAENSTQGVYLCTLVNIVWGCVICFVVLIMTKQMSEPGIKFTNVHMFTENRLKGWFFMISLLKKGGGMHIYELLKEKTKVFCNVDCWRCTLVYVGISLCTLMYIHQSTITEGYHG